MSSAPLPATDFHSRLCFRLREADILLIVLDASCISTQDASLRRRVDDIIDETLRAARHSPMEEATLEAGETGTHLLDADVEYAWAPPETMVVLNKTDLIKSADASSIASALACKDKVSRRVVIETSCVNGDGLDNLMDFLSDVVKKM